jgi:hypothetical protein
LYNINIESEKGLLNKSSGDISPMIKNMVYYTIKTVSKKSKRDGKKRYKPVAYRLSKNGDLLGRFVGKAFRWF